MLAPAADAARAREHNVTIRRERCFIRENPQTEVGRFRGKTASRVEVKYREIRVAERRARALSPPPVFRGRVREGVPRETRHWSEPPPRPSPGVPGEGEKVGYRLSLH